MTPFFEANLLAAIEGDLRALLAKHLAAPVVHSAP
jgi:hypothetical protein